MSRNYKVDLEHKNVQIKDKFVIFRSGIMSKNTSSNAFRRIDVDQYAEDNYKVSYNCSGSFLVNEF